MLARALLDYAFVSRVRVSMSGDEAFMRPSSHLLYSTPLPPLPSVYTCAVVGGPPCRTHLSFVVRVDNTVRAALSQVVELKRVLVRRPVTVLSVDMS